MMRLIIYAIWVLPETLYGLCCIAFGGAQFLRWTDGMPFYLAKPGGRMSRFFASSRKGAMTIGPFIVLNKESYINTRLVAHELRHVEQGWWFGPLKSIIYFGCSLVAWLSGGDLYKDNWMERDARRASGEEVVTNG